MKKISMVFVILIALVMLSGCQATPETAAVISKNDGTLEAALNNTATETEETNAQEEDQEVAYTNSFTSTDGTITFDVDLDVPVADIDLPVLVVTPHTITSEEAEHIAHVIFGDQDIYEYSTELSKSQIEDEILTMEEFISDWDALVDYYGGDEVLAQMTETQYEASIQNYEQMYEDAPEVVVNQVCDWQFSSTDDSSSYLYGTEEIMAMSTMDGLPYVYWVTNRNADDYRLHNIYAYVDDTQVGQNEIYSDTAPSETDIDSYMARARDLLDALDMGEWEIVSCDTESWIGGENNTLYSTTIYATPVYVGIPMTYQTQLTNLKSEDAYASNYYYEQICMIFSGERLVSFDLTSPMDVVSEVQSNVDVLSFDEIMDVFESQMELYDASYYLNSSTVAMKVDEVDLGLSRIRIKNNQTDFYLVPTYTFSGYATFYDEDGGEIMWQNDDGTITTAATRVQYVTINAVDGSIVNTELGY